MTYKFVWKKTGERRVPRFGEWYLATDMAHVHGPRQYNGTHHVGLVEIIVSTPVDSRSVYADGAIIGAEVAL